MRTTTVILPNARRTPVYKLDARRESVFVPRKTASDLLYVPPTTIVLFNFNTDFSDVFGRTVTTYGSPTISGSAKFGAGCADFTADSYGNDKYLIFSPAVQISAPWTIEWFKTDTLQNIYLEARSDNPTIITRIYAWESAVGYAVASSLSTSMGIQSDVSVLHAIGVGMGGEWGHVAIVSDGERVSIYADGSRVATTNGNFGLHVDTIGIDIPYKDIGNYSWTNQFAKCDDFRITQTALYFGTTYDVPTSELKVTYQRHRSLMMCQHQS